jgi:hypothetical protein
MMRFFAKFILRRFSDEGLRTTEKALRMRGFRPY